MEGADYMKVIVTGRNMHVRETLVDQVESKLEKFDKYFRSDIEIHATFSHQKADQIVEITIPIKQGTTFRAEERSDNMETSIDMAVDKLARQISKHKTKLEKRYRGHETIRFEEIPPAETAEPDGPQIVRNKKFFMKPMDPEEAAMQMELLGHSFFVFRNRDTEEMNVVYARKDGKFGLIEPEDME